MKKISLINTIWSIALVWTTLLSGCSNKETKENENKIKSEEILKQTDFTKNSSGIIVTMKDSDFAGSVTYKGICYEIHKHKKHDSFIVQWYDKDWNSINNYTIIPELKDLNSTEPCNKRK